MMLEEQEAYEKVRCTLVTDHVTEKRGIVEFGLTFVSEKKPKKPPRKQMEMKKGVSQKWRRTTKWKICIAPHAGVMIAYKQILFFRMFIENQGNVWSGNSYRPSKTKRMFASRS